MRLEKNFRPDCKVRDCWARQRVLHPISNKVLPKAFVNRSEKS